MKRRQSRAVAFLGSLSWLEISDVDQSTGLKVEGSTSTCTLKKFCDDNAEDVEIVEAVKALQVGASMHLGGGAAPLIYVERKS